MYWIVGERGVLVQSEQPKKSPHAIIAENQFTYALTVYDIIDVGNNEVLVGTHRYPLSKIRLLTQEEFDEFRSFKDIVSKEDTTWEKLPKASKLFHPWNNAIILYIQQHGVVIPQVRKVHDRRLSLLSSLRNMEGKPEKCMSVNASKELLELFNCNLEDIFRYKIK